jgi:hypothetical protein
MPILVWITALWFSFPADAAPPGYSVTKQDYHGCELSLGPAEADGVVPMRAECVWRDVKLETFKAQMSNYAEHDTYFEAVVDSEVRRTEGTRALVYQKHRSSGIADREVLLWMSHQTVDGYERYGWTHAKGEPLTPQSGNVAAGRKCTRLHRPVVPNLGSRGQCHRPAPMDGDTLTAATAPGGR